MNRQPDVTPREVPQLVQQLEELQKLLIGVHNEAAHIENAVHRMAQEPAGQGTAKDEAPRPVITLETRLNDALDLLRTHAQHLSAIRQRLDRLV